MRPSSGEETTERADVQRLSVNEQSVQTTSRLWTDERNRNEEGSEEEKGLIKKTAHSGRVQQYNTDKEVGEYHFMERVMRRKKQRVQPHLYGDTINQMLQE